ncbi:unnamed protein product [Rotaria sp. Silwood1]|nr:unnamed protein product [Rotaria sp. Silwood1]
MSRVVQTQRVEYFLHFPDEKITTKSTLKRFREVLLWCGIFKQLQMTFPFMAIRLQNHTYIREKMIENGNNEQQMRYPTEDIRFKN